MRHPFLSQARSNARLPRNTRARRMSLERLEERQLLSYTDFELSNLLPANGGDGSKGFVVNGTDTNGEIGGSFDYRSVGDVTGDGIDDFILGAAGDVGPTSMTIGHVYLIFGQSSGFPAELDLHSLGGTTGYVIDGITVGDRMSVFSGGAGDLNGDGIPDLCIGAIFATPSSDRIKAGQSYVIYGGTAHLVALDLADGTQDGHIALSNLSGANGFTINGIKAGDNAGRVTGAGDLNGDGFGDLLIGAAQANSNAGETYVVFGSQTVPAIVELSSLDGSNGFTIRGTGASDRVGVDVAGVGDVNHDGFADVAIGAAFASPSGRTSAGQTHVIFGRASFPAVFSLSSLNGSNGFTVNGGAASDFLGWSVSGAADVNGDGIDDVLIGAKDVDVPLSNAGAAYVIFGKATSFPATLEVASLNGTNGFAVHGSVTNGEAGTQVSGAGDANGDGYDDILISEPFGNSISNAGRSYLVYGRPNFGASFDLASLLAANGGDGSAGFAINGFEPSSSACRVAGIGDINADGLTDLRVGSPYSSPNGLASAGRAYIIYGKPSPAPITKFYVPNDASGDRTFEYSTTGTPVEDYTLNSGNTAPRGATSTAAGDKVWVVDSNKNLYIYNTSGGLMGSWTAGGLPSNATVEGITTNGTDVWIVDARQDKVFKYTGAASRLSGSQNAASSFSLNSSNTGPKDIVTDGTYLWVVNDSSTDKVFKYNLSGTLQGSWTISGAGSSPTGITLNPSSVGNLWIVDSGTDRVYQFDNAAGRTSGSQSPSTSFALAADNTNPQGIADPPSGGTVAAVSTSRAEGLAPSLRSRMSLALHYRSQPVIIQAPDNQLGDLPDLGFSASPIRYRRHCPPPG